MYERTAAWGREKIAPYLGRYVMYAADSTVLDFARVFTGALRELRDDPTACVWFIVGGDQGSDGSIRRPRPPTERVMDEALAGIIVSGRRGDRPPVDSVTGQALIDAMFERLIRSHGPAITDHIALIADAPSARARPADACEGAYAMYDGILAMPPDQGATLLRYLLASGGSS
jgi:hypothetical protein